MAERVRVPKTKKMTARQMRFCNNYLANGGNIKKAMLDAGYSEITADKNSQHMLDVPLIKEYIEKQLSKVDKTDIMTVQEVQEWWTSIIMDKNLNLAQRVKASELLVKSNGGFIDKMDINSKEEKIVLIDDISTSFDACEVVEDGTEEIKRTDS